MKATIKAVSLFLLSILVLSCNSTSKKKEIDTTLDDALLWRISGNGLSKDAFLFVLGILFHLLFWILYLKFYL
jgi:hypothetical protein